MSKIIQPEWFCKINESKCVSIDCLDSFNKAIVEKYEINKELLPVDFENLLGFIYLVTFSDGTFYIGKKNLFHNSKVKKGKKELQSMTDKRGSKFKQVVKESDWKTYFGSIKDKDFESDIKSGNITIISKEVLCVASTKSQLTYLETKFQFVYNVLEVNNSKNNNILGKFYRKSLEYK